MQVSEFFGIRLLVATFLLLQLPDGFLQDDDIAFELLDFGLFLFAFVFVPPIDF